MKKIKLMMKLFPMLLLGLLVFNSCEGDIDDLGSQFFDGNAAEGYDKAYGVIAYNVNNNDTIRTDASVLDSVRIGAFTEPVFGMQKSSYVTQVRLNAYNPDFGKNVVLDSVVLTIKPKYQTAADSVKTTTVDEFYYGEGSIKSKKVVSTYPMIKYGKHNSTMTLKVNEVDSFLGAVSEKITSDKDFVKGQELGSKELNGTVNSVVITQSSDSKELVNLATSIRIPLDKNFFQTKIINKQGSAYLNDLASFIRYFKGISVSVQENDGYMFTISPNDLQLVMYYKKDKTETDGSVTRESSNTSLDLGASNVHYCNIKYDRPSSYKNVMLEAGSNSVLDNGQSFIYTQGMGGAGLGLKIPAKIIDELRKQFKENKIAIASAKIRLYNSEVEWDNSYRKPYSFVVKENDSAFIPDMTILSGAGYSLLKTANLKTKDAYYDISITKSLKDIIEKDISYKDFIVNVGSFKSNSSTGTLIGPYSTDRAYTPYRIVLKGTDSNNVGNQIDGRTNKSAQLRIKYTKK